MTAPVDTWRRIAPSYFEHCWDSTDRVHRQPILDAVASLMPATSLLEIGCNAGVNLRLIHERWPTVELIGLDANQGALRYAAAKRLPAKLFHCDIRDPAESWLINLCDKQVDIVLSCYCLAYIEPDEIAGVLAHMRRIARVGLVIAEPMEYHGPSRRIDAGIPEWSHNYRDLLPSPRGGWWTPVDPPVERLNAIFTVRL